MAYAQIHAWCAICTNHSLWHLIVLGSHCKCCNLPRCHQQILTILGRGTSGEKLLSLELIHSSPNKGKRTVGVCLLLLQCLKIHPFVSQKWPISRRFWRSPDWEDISKEAFLASFFQNSDGFLFIFTMKIMKTQVIRVWHQFLEIPLDDSLLHQRLLLHSSNCHRSSHNLTLNEAA